MFEATFQYIAEERIFYGQVSRVNQKATTEKFVVTNNKTRVLNQLYINN